MKPTAAQMRVMRRLMERGGLLQVFEPIPERGIAETWIEGMHVRWRTFEALRRRGWVARGRLLERAIREGVIGFARRQLKPWRRIYYLTLMGRAAWREGNDA